MFNFTEIDFILEFNLMGTKIVILMTLLFLIIIDTLSLLLQIIIRARLVF